MSSTRRQFLYATTVGSLAVAGCSGSSDGNGGSGGSVTETSQVSMVDTQFQPRNVHVDSGTTVTWTNEDSAQHTVTSASENWSFDETVPSGESVEYEYAESGVYDVYCAFHGSETLSGMSMKVGVGSATIEDPLGSDGGSGGGGVY